MAMELKKDNKEAQASAPVSPRVPQKSGSSLGFGGICLIVAGVALLAAIGSQFLAMKAMFVF